MPAGGWIDDDLLAALGLEELVPAPWARWRPLVLEGLRFFLAQLPAGRLAGIVAEQLALEAGASSARRLVALLSHCPTLHKLGQVLARHRGLPLELRRHLQSLESLPASSAMGTLLARIREELPANAPVTVAREALAEGSVAVVVPFAYEARGRLRHGVFKVLKPGIETRLMEDLGGLDGLAACLERRGRQLGLPPLDYREHLQSVRGLLLKEIRLEVEQGNLRRAAAFYADEPGILVPRLLPWCTPRLTAMERVAGIKVTDAVLSPGLRRSLAARLTAALLAKPFWSRADAAIFHADLHGGNVLLAEDGRLAILDWSLTASLSKSHREALVGIALGGLSLDAMKIRQAVAALGTLPADDPTLAEVVEGALDRLVLRGRLPGFEWLLELLDGLALRTAAGFREDFALFRKSWLSLSGVLGDLAEDSSPDTALLAAGVGHFLAEAPARWLAPLDSPQFSTHVSNADILQLWGTSWLACLRYWQRRWRLAASDAAWRSPPVIP